MACSPEQARINGRKGGRKILEATKLRRALFDAAEKDTKVILDALMGRVKSGDIAAIKELLDRVLGKPTQPVEHSGGVVFASIDAKERERVKKIFSD